MIDGTLCIHEADPATFDARQIPEQYRGDCLFGSDADCKKVLQIGRVIGLAFDGVSTAEEAVSQVGQILGSSAGSVTECSGTSTEEPTAE